MLPFLYLLDCLTELAVDLSGVGMEQCGPEGMQVIAAPHMYARTVSSREQGYDASLVERSGPTRARLKRVRTVPWSFFRSVRLR